MAVGSFAEQTAAIRTRDAIQTIVAKLIDERRPTDRNGVVKQIDRDNSTCKVLLAGDVSPVVVNMGAIQPSSVGQVVRVSGSDNSRWIVNVLGSLTLTATSADELAEPIISAVTSLGGAALVDWDSPESTGDLIVQFEVEVARGPDFTAANLARSFYTRNTLFSVPNLEIGHEYWFRVRQVVGAGYGAPTVSDWSVEVSHVISGHPGSSSDGEPPESSPAVSCDSGLGFVTASWLPTVNSDPVVYDVHASYESGFTPGPDNYQGQTSSTFWMVPSLGGSQLSYDDPVYVRVIAHDVDGSAPAGPQGWATARRVETGDAGSIWDAITDGEPPASSPVVAGVDGGPGWLFITWEHITNNDSVTYEVHLAESQTFLPTPGTLVVETPSTFAFLRKQPLVMGGGVLEYEKTYYVRVFAKDADGYAEFPSAAVAGQLVKVGQGDLGEGAVGGYAVDKLAIGNAHIGNAAISEAKIVDAAITNAKIANASISSAKIGDLAVTSAKIADAAIVTAKIQNAAITDAKISSLNASKIIAGTIDASLVSVINLNADEIIAGTITGIDISGSTLTGVTVKTGATGARAVMRHWSTGNGSRVELFTGDYSDDLTPLGTFEAFDAVSGDTVQVQTRLTMAVGGQLANFGIYKPDTEARFFVNADAAWMPPKIRSGPWWVDTTIAADSWQLKHNLHATSTMNINRYEQEFAFGSNAEKFRMQADGNIVLTRGGVAIWSTGTSISDEQYKKNIVELDPGDAGVLDMLSGFVPIKFEYDLAGMPEGQQLGLSAQNMVGVFPQAVDALKNEDGSETLNLKALDVANLALIGVHELLARVEQLEGAN